jgi:hypothetical protein
LGQHGRSVHALKSGRRRSYRCHLDHWLDEVIGVAGIPIPYGAQNASPHIERFVGTLREEALDHKAAREPHDRHFGLPKPGLDFSEPGIDTS